MQPKTNANNEIDASHFPLSSKDIAKEQSKDTDLQDALQKSLDTSSDKYQTVAYHGGGKINELICHNNKIVIPDPLQDRVVDWYHHSLGHPGIN